MTYSIQNQYNTDTNLHPSEAESYFNREDKQEELKKHEEISATIDRVGHLVGRYFTSLSG